MNQRYFLSQQQQQRNFEMSSRFDKGFQPEGANQNSNNMYPDPNQMNSISKFHNFMRDQSINFRVFSADYSRHIGQQQLDNPQAGNTINFQEANRRNLFVNQGQIKQGKQAHQQEQDLKEGISEIDPNKKKGLKYLSFILNRLLRKSKFDNNQIVNQCIEKVLPNETQNPNYARQAQNIRRRIYDSINVMSAIGLVVRNGPSQIYIKKNQRNSLTQRIKTREEIMQEIAENDQNFKKVIKDKLINIKAKKVHLQKLRESIKLLKTHLQRNTMINEEEQIASDWNLDKEEVIKSQKIYFPILIVGTMQQEITIKCYGKNRNKIKIKYENNQLKILSQLDSLKHIYERAENLECKQMNNRLAIKDIENNKQIQKWKLINKQSYEEFVVSCFQDQEHKAAKNIEDDDHDIVDEFPAKQNIKINENKKLTFKEVMINRIMNTNFLDKNYKSLQKQKKQTAVINFEQESENSYIFK